jgi:hypothetical protein
MPATPQPDVVAPHNHAMEDLPAGIPQIQTPVVVRGTATETTNSAVFVALANPRLAAVVAVGGAGLTWFARVLFTGTLGITGVNRGTLGLFLDGVQQTTRSFGATNDAGGFATVAMDEVLALTSGAHLIEVKWLATGGVLTANTTERALIVEPYALRS